MMHTGQYLGQRQTLQQRLSPQQIQYIKLLQLPTVSIEMRIKEELEQNPLLEEYGDDHPERDDERVTEDDRQENTESTDELSEIDWDSILANNDYEGKTYSSANGEDWVEIPKPYYENLLEDLERQVSLLNMSEKELLLAEQIIGSIDEDGYLRRDLNAIVDSIIFNSGEYVQMFEAEEVLKKIQRLDPPGIAARDLQECLQLQLEQLPSHEPGRNIALKIVRDEWELFEKKHFDKVQKKLNLTDEQLREAYECVQGLDPKPGGNTIGEEVLSYVVPDFTVYYQPMEDDDERGDFIIELHRKNLPALRISRAYKSMWDELQRKAARNETDNETRTFIKSKMDAARSFMEAIQQRSNTLMNVMRTIVSLQETFFRFGTTLRPMILKDIADRIGMDISTISRVVNGKYVQTEFGVYELKYFFNEGIDTEDGESASNRDVKNHIADLINKESKAKPLSDDAIADELKKMGYIVARRTVSKYREQMGLPVARLRKTL
jgi:RNA polymerase sigma-54 factor